MRDSSEDLNIKNKTNRGRRREEVGGNIGGNEERPRNLRDKKF